MERKEIYTRIDAAKAAMRPTHPDAATVNTVIEKKTIIQYENTVRNLFGCNPEIGKLIRPKDPQRVIAVLHEKAKTVSTLRKYARSVRHAALKALNALLKKIDTAQRAGQWDEVERIVSSEMFHAYTVLTQMMPADYQVGWEPERKRHGKKSSISQLPDDWREQMAAKVEGQFRIPSIVALLTGCRPAEVERGVLIERIDGALYITIKSAKVTKKAGQEQRRFRIADHPLTNILMDFMDISDETRNRLPVAVNHGNSLTTHLRAKAKALWPARKESITTYSARHALAADCKKAIHDGADPDLVSQVLGHVVDKTASYYGSISQGGGISVAPTDVVVPKEIRHKAKERNKRRAIQRGLIIENALLGNTKS